MIDILDISSWNTFWSFINAIATVTIGYFAYKISKAQLKIEKYKQDDFIYQHRLELYKSLNDLLIDIIISLQIKVLNNDRTITPEYVAKFKIEITKMRNTAVLLFQDDNIHSLLIELQEKINFLFIGKEKEFDESFHYINSLVNDEKIEKLFSKYLNLTGDKNHT